MTWLATSTSTFWHPLLITIVIAYRVELTTIVLVSNVLHRLHTTVQSDILQFDFSASLYKEAALFNWRDQGNVKKKEITSSKPLWNEWVQFMNKFGSCTELLDREQVKFIERFQNARKIISFETLPS